MSTATEIRLALNAVIADIESARAKVDRESGEVERIRSGTARLLQGRDRRGDEAKLRAAETELRHALDQVNIAKAALKHAHGLIVKYGADNFRAGFSGGHHGWASVSEAGDEHVAEARSDRRWRLMEDFGWAAGGLVLAGVSLAGPLGAGTMAAVVFGFAAAKLARTYQRLHRDGVRDAVLDREMKAAATDFVLDLVGAASGYTVFGAAGKALGGALDVKALGSSMKDLRKIAREARRDEAVHDAEAFVKDKAVAVWTDIGRRLHQRAHDDR